METMNKQKAKTILSNVVLATIDYLANTGNETCDSDYNMILDILTCRYLAKNTAVETSYKTGYSYNIVVDILQAVKHAVKGKTLEDFA